MQLSQINILGERLLNSLSLSLSLSLKNIASFMPLLHKYFILIRLSFQAIENLLLNINSNFNPQKFLISIKNDASYSVNYSRFKFSLYRFSCLETNQFYRT